MSAVLERLQADAERLFGSSHTLVEPLTFEVRESSEVTRARITSPAGVRHVFAKVVTPRRAGEGLDLLRARLVQDFATTTHVFEVLKHTADLRAVEPVVCYPDLPAVVTEQASGAPLDRFLATEARWPVPPERLDTLGSALTRVGRWISMFQQATPALAPSSLDLDATRGYIDARLRKLVALPGARFSESDRHAVLGFLDLRAADVPASELVEVAVHGDITPSNIVVAPDCVTVLDFAMAARGSRYFDVARLYTQLEFYTAKPQYRPRVMQRLQQAALAGFEPGLRPDVPLFEISAVQHVVCHYLSHARRPGRFPASLYSHHLCRLHRHWLRDRAGRVSAVSAATRSSSVASSVR